MSSLITYCCPSLQYWGDTLTERAFSYQSLVTLLEAFSFSPSKGAHVLVVLPQRSQQLGEDLFEILPAENLHTVLDGIVGTENVG